MQTVQAETITAPFATTSVSPEDILQQLVRQQKTRKKWLIVQPMSTTSMMVDSGSVSMPLNLIMVATVAGRLFSPLLMLLLLPPEASTHQKPTQ